MNKVGHKYVLEHFADALENGYIRAFYQPIFRSVTTKMCCAEALARWCDPEYGLISPADFVPVLESNDLICDLDLEILRQTCVFYRKLCERGTGLHSFSINLSRHDFKREDLFESVNGILEECKVPPEAIKLEITESIMLEDIDTFRRIFRKFHEAGFSIWIDDFGNAYSSLSMLQNYEFDMMKFDMLFMKNFCKKSRQVLGSQINMAKSLGIHTLAEGVETEEQKAYLTASGCEVMQGFLFSKPIPDQDLIVMIDQNAEMLEPAEDWKYWNQIGRLNFLSPNPLDEYENGDNNIPDCRQDQSGVPLALVECDQNRAFYIYVSEEYERNVKSLGYPSIKELEHIFNDGRSDQYLMMRRLALDTISGRSTHELEYINNDVFYKLRARCVGRKKDRAMLALQLRTFDSENEKETARINLEYGNALFSTYEIVTLVYPERGASTRIYAAEMIPSYDNVGAKTLEESIQKFCNAEIVPEDRARYLRFFDLKTLEERVGASPRGFIQSVFRLSRHKEKEKKWRSIRISRVPSNDELVFIYTIQMVHPKEVRIFETIAKEHPEMLMDLG